MSSHEAAAAAARFLTVPEDSAGQRIDNFLITQLKGAPRTLVYRILRTGEVRVNKGRIKPDYRVAAGDIIRVPPLRLAEAAAPVQPGAGISRDLKSRIIYEQDGLLVINKPAGLAVHGGSGVAWGVIEALRVVLPEKPFLELVHRLDRDTSGLLMVAEKRSVLRDLHDQLREGRVQKVYVALLSGRLKGAEHTVNAPLLKTNLPNGERIVRVARDGKEALTEFKVLDRIGNTTLVEARPKTGRTHQIRVHAQYLGHALVGDEKYGNDDVNKAMKAYGSTRLFLHARDLNLKLAGMTKSLRLTCPLEPDLEAVLENLRRG
ncbi:MAG: 23S rRNA pseudouridine(955/2504/2580) synthase RluC [Moraxellaceae bacterium]|nr:23S rRNA pseudouridine(955/2504/2580) synthase RluC [Moraxellaceae bacterium]HCT40424.1 23S rRNA pseudouridine(955/2504/2580) synthase RluC [Moraxellaceae bacterium]